MMLRMRVFACVCAASCEWKTETRLWPDDLFFYSYFCVSLVLYALDPPMFIVSHILRSCYFFAFWFPMNLSAFLAVFF